MKKNKSLLEAADAFILAHYRDNMGSQLVYHNFDHIMVTRKHALKIAEGMNLSTKETELVELGALFHDSGFAGNGEGHEEKGCVILEKFLSENDYPKEDIEKIKGAIRGTKMPQAPTSLLEKVLADADLAYLGTKSFEERSGLLRTEWGLIRGQTWSDKDWAKGQIEFLTCHAFHTSFALQEYGPKKAKNISALFQQNAELEKRFSKDKQKLQIELDKLDQKKEKEKRPERGIETMLRVMSRNHMELSAMADNKANIMISINAIIISIVLSSLVPKFDKNVFLILPSAILLVTCLTTIIFATLSTRPKISGGKFTPEDLKHRKVNLLFFGNFFKMKMHDFEDGMTELMQDKDFLYGSMVKDIYFLGQVLGRKYQLIRISYTVFMYGLIVSVASFALAFYMWGLVEA